MATPIDGIVVELHPGGRFETLMIGEHGSHRMVATFTDVVPPERLAWVDSATGMQTTSTLHDLGDGTTAVVIHQRNVPEPMRLPEARAGFLTSLDKLEKHLAHLTRETDMTDPQSWVAPTYKGLADLLAATTVDDLGRPLAVRQVAGAPRRRARDDACPADPRAVRGRDGGGRRRLRRPVQHRGRTGCRAARRRPPRPAPIPETARVAAPGRWRSRCAEPCRHPLAGCDGRARPARRSRRPTR